MTAGPGQTQADRPGWWLQEDPTARHRGARQEMEATVADTPQQRAGDEDDLGTTPSAPQARTDLAGDDDRQDAEAAPDDDLQEPVTREEIERRQLDDDVDVDDT